MRKDNGDVEEKRGLEEEGEGIGKGKDICVVGLQGVESVVRIACFCQKDKTVINFPPHAVTSLPFPLPVTRTHTHTYTHTVTTHNSPLK